MAEKERTNRGKPYPGGRNGRMRGNVNMRLPGRGDVTGHREGDWPANCKDCADGMSAVVPGSGSVGKPDSIAD